MWCPDDVLYHLGLYMHGFDPNGGKEQETNFAEAILSFRKTLGYDNPGGNIKPEHIVEIFRAGNPMSP